MINRSANATIKGYLYQFDHTIVQVLSAPTSTAQVTVEGIEDVDLAIGDERLLTQCKYYEGTEYNHSVIKGAVIHMLRHFKENGSIGGQLFRYGIYGHYSGGQKKLPATLDIDFLKKNFFTYTHEGVTHEVHLELSVSDVELESFCQRLKIDIEAKSYDDQQNEAVTLLKANIPGCQQEDAEAFFYPNAVNVVQSLAVQGNIKDRRITKARFIKEVDRKDPVFSLWLRKKFGDDHYARAVKRKHFRFPSSTKVPNSSVIPPFLTRALSRGYAASASFCFGVIPPMPVLGRS